MLTGNRLLVEVDIGSFIRFRKFISKINNEVGSVPRVTTLRALKDLLFFNLSDSYIVILEPLLEVSIIAKTNIVTRIGTSLMNAYAM